MQDGDEGEGEDGDGDDDEDGENSDAGGSQSEEEGLLPLDAFEGDTATSLDVFAEAASGPEVFLRPNAEIAGLARLAAKACSYIPCKLVGESYSTYGMHKMA